MVSAATASTIRICLRHLALAIVLTLGLAAQAHAGTVTDLGDVVPMGLNSHDQVVGDVLDSSSDDHAELWSAGTLTRLPQLGSSDSSDAYAINAAGRIAGDDYATTSSVHGVYWNGTTAAHQVGPFFTTSQDFTVLNGVDTAGDLVGTTPASGASDATGFIYKNGTEIPIGAADLDGQQGATAAGAITPNGARVLGQVSGGLASDGYYLWSAATPDAHGTKLDITPSKNGALGFDAAEFSPLIQDDLASDGTVVGYKGAGSSKVFYIRLPAGTETQVKGLHAANAVNASHVVVGDILGTTLSDPLHAAIWSNGTVTDLNKLLPPGTTGWDLLEAFAINDSGDVVGVALHNGHQVGFLLKPSGFTVSGFVFGESCGDGGGCRRSGLSGVRVLVNGTARDGTPVSVTDRSGDDGSWSVMVPAGSYAAGPTDDGSSFDLPGFDPNEHQGIVVGPSRANVDFTACAGPAAGSATDLAARRATAHAASAVSDAVNPCTSVYTVTVGGSISKSPIVDPGPGARFNDVPNGVAHYRGQTGLAARLFESLSNLYTVPECFDQADLAKFHNHLQGPDWYSYIQGPLKLPKYTVKFAFDQHAQETSLVGTPKVGVATVTKWWKWRDPVRSNHQFGRCQLTEDIPVMYLPVMEKEPGRFTIIVAWGFPFGSTGAKGTHLSKSEFAKTVDELQENAPSLVTAYSRSTDTAKFALWLLFKEVVQHAALHFVGLPVAEATLGRFLGKIAAKLPAAAVEAVAKGSTTLAARGVTGHKLNHLTNAGKLALELKEYGEYGAAFETGEPIMSTVIRGEFHTYLAQNSPAVAGTTLGVTVKSTRVPTLSVKVSRRAYSWPDQKIKAFSGPLPWANDGGSKASPETANPYRAHDPTIVSDPFFSNIGYGPNAQENFKSATKQLPKVNLAIHYGGLYQLIPEEQDEAPVPDCPTDKDEGRNLSASAGTEDTICWLFEDGDA